MPGIQDIIRVTLVSNRHDIINFAEDMCSDTFRLTIASDFSSLSYTDSSLLLIDASLFIDFDLDIIEIVEKCSGFSICLIPSDIPRTVVVYAEKTFKYSISFPVNIEYFRSYCLRVRAVLPGLRKTYLSNKSETKSIPESFSGFFCGKSEIIRKVRSQIVSAAYSKEPVLILGETGVGKTTAAQVIHEMSDRKNKKMVYVSLSTIVETLAESAFFGHKRGSYTNADYESRGYFEAANGSSMLLDEFGVASLAVQSMLLTVLDSGNYKKIGDDREYHTDVRMIFATNADVEEMLRTGLFRRDLYFRICDNLIKIPPLREHREDIREMVLQYLDANTIITEEAIELLVNYDWPGNIRELHTCLRRAVKNSSNKVITAESIDFGDINFLQ